MNDAVIRKLLESSSITEAQFSTLIQHKRVKLHELTLAEATQQRGEKRIAKGTYYRILSQARTKLRQSVVNIVIGIALGNIDKDSLLRLINALGSKPIEQYTPELVELIVQIASKSVT
jgi:hypothetical protein